MIFHFACQAFRAIFLAARFALLVGVGGCANAGEPMVLPTDRAPLVVSTANGDVDLSVEIAVTENEHQRGLMYRDRLPDGHGMLFVMAETEPVMFWMQNTPSALDIVFIEENGLIATIKRGEPLSKSIIPSEKPVRFVLEIAAGEAARLGLALGDEVRHPVIKAISGK